MEGLLDDPDPIQSQALLALSKAYFGRAYKQKMIMDKGALCYGKALCHLNSILQDPERMLHISALTNAMKLSMYEVSTCPRVNGDLTAYSQAVYLGTERQLGST